MNKECDHCGIRFDFNKSNMKEMLFAKSGDTFKSTEKNAKTGVFSGKVAFHTITWELDEDIKFTGIKCECCGEINWMTDYIPTFSCIESNGWYIKKYGNLKCHEVSRDTKIYGCTKQEAKDHILDNIVGDVLGGLDE